MILKRPNGYGTVYKLSGRRRKPWIARVTTGWTTAVAKKGKHAGQEVERQLYQTIGYYETKQEALHTDHAPDQPVFSPG